MQTVDIIIVGGGMIGLSLACGLQSNGLQVVVIECKPPDITTQDARCELRVSAINMASEKLLSSIGVWSEIISHHASSYFRKVEVWDKDSFGHIILSNESIGYNNLGYIIKNSIVRQVLWRKAQQYSNITLIAPDRIQQIFWGKNDVFTLLKSGDVIIASLIVGADGINSWLRNKANIPLTWWDYNHCALIANISTTEPHNSVARQVFHNDGILAFLPLNDPYLCSIVWSISPKKAKQIQNMKPEVFNKMLYVVFDSQLGLCKLESERQVIPLFGSYARKFAGHRIVLVGDAAHNIHPLVGQGVNLGFMDVAVLIEEIHYLCREYKDIGKYDNLRRYERNRKYRAAIMLAEIQGFLMLFSGANSVKKMLRNIGLRFINNSPIIKNRLLRQAMGLNYLPEWLR